MDIENAGREKFESVYCGNNQKLITRNSEGDYVSPCIQDAWSGWLECWITLSAK